MRKDQKRLDELHKPSVAASLRNTSCSSASILIHHTSAVTAAVCNHRCCSGKQAGTDMHTLITDVHTLTPQALTEQINHSNLPNAHFGV
jgi:hypothetical protein